MKKLSSRVNTRESLRKKMKNFGYASMIALTLGGTLPGCDSNKTEVKKSAETYQEAVDNVKALEKKIKNKKEEIGEDKEELQNDENDLALLQQQLITAKKTEKEKLNETDNEVEIAKKAE